MNRKNLSRTIAGVIMALLVAWGAYSSGSRMNHLGPDGFVQLEASRYGHMFATDGEVVRYSIVAALLGGAFVLVYESLAYGVSKLIFTPRGGKPADGGL